MNITLNNGKTVCIPFEQWDKMTDEEYLYFLDSDYGREINDPFFDSQIERTPTELNEEDYMDYEDFE